MRFRILSSIPPIFPDMVQKVPDGEFEALLGQPMPKAQMEPGERFTINNCLEDAKDTKWGSVLWAC